MHHDGAIPYLFDMYNGDHLLNCGGRVDPFYQSYHLYRNCDYVFLGVGCFFSHLCWYGTSGMSSLRNCDYLDLVFHFHNVMPLYFRVGFV